MDPGQRGSYESPAQENGFCLRLVPGSQHLPARVLQVEPVDLPQDVRARPGLPEGKLGQLVPLLPDRPGQRAGRRRDVLALFLGRRAEEDGAVGSQDHRLCRGTALRPRPAGQVARACPGHAEKLDRPERRGLSEFRRPVRKKIHPGFHHPSGHDLRGDVPGPLARTSPGGRVGPGPQRGGAPRLDCQDDRRRPGQAGNRGSGQGRRRHGRDGRQSVHRKARPDLAGQLCPDGIRDRGDHGRPGPRRPRFRFCQKIRPADRRSHRPRRRRAFAPGIGGRAVRGSRRPREQRTV